MEKHIFRRQVLRRIARLLLELHFRRINAAKFVPFNALRVDQAAVTQEVEDIDQVRSRAIDRAAVLTFAQFQRTKERLPIGDAVNLLRALVCYGMQRQFG